MLNLKCLNLEIKNGLIYEGEISNDLKYVVIEQYQLMET